MATLETSNDQVPAVHGKNTANGSGVFGEGQDWQGVSGHSVKQVGVGGKSEEFIGVWGESASVNPAFPGVFGLSENWQGVAGKSTKQAGVFGESQDWDGVSGHSVNHTGVAGVSEKFVGVWGESHSPDQAGVFGINENWHGVAGKSTKQAGVFGLSQDWQGVSGHSTNQAGVVGTSDQFVGVWAENSTPGHPALFAKGPRLAGRFEGDVEVTGDVRLLNADCAEDFDIADADSVDPGTVMVLAEEGVLRESRQAYDKRVAGVVSGAGDYRPGIILDKQRWQPNRKAIALLGKVYCKVDASYGSIDVGDLLTTAPTPGHAMKVGDPLEAFGAVIGKALRSLDSGRGLIPILIALQ
jgi:hypothetical protein